MLAVVVEYHSCLRHQADKIHIGVRKIVFVIINLTRKDWWDQLQVTHLKVISFIQENLKDISRL